MPGSLSRKAGLLWLAAAVALAAVLALTEFSLLHHDPFFGMDLKVYQFGGKAARSLGDPYAKAYAPGLYFTYPPFSAALFIPMSFVSMSVVAPLLIFVSLLALQGVLWYSFDLLGVRDTRLRAPLVLAATVALMWLDPVRDTLRLGQVNLILMLLVVADFARGDRRRHGLLIGLAAGVKLTPAIFLIHLLVTRRTWAAVTGFAAFLATVLVGLAAYPGPTWKYFTKLVYDSGRVGFPQSPLSQSMRSTFTRLMHTTSGVNLPWAVAAAAVLALGLWAAARAERRGERLLAVTLVGLTGLLVSPISWDHHWVWVVPGFLVLLHTGAVRVRTLAARAGIAALAAALAAVFIVRPFDWVPFGDRPDLALTGWDQLWAAPYVLVGLVALVVVALLLRGTPRPAPAERGAEELEAVG